MLVWLRCGPRRSASISSPATHLRAPLLWLLVPLLAGLAAARVWPAPESGLGSLALGAAAAGAAALACAFRSGRPAAIGWGLLIGSAAGLAGFVLVHARHPDLPEDRTRPPREVTLTIRVRQIYPVDPGARQFSGLGEVVAASELDRPLMGRLMYFSAIRRISVLPRRSGSYEMRGVIESLPAGPAGGGFHDYLANLGIRHRLMRTHVRAETAAPGRFEAFCARTQDRLEEFLREGLDRWPGPASLYLAMLLGEKAVLTAEQENAYMRSGTFHIFSISGLHVAVIAGALYATGNFLRVPRRIGTAVTLVVLWLYVQVTGASAPAIRSFLMVAFFLSSRTFQLPGNPLAALAGAALATVLWDPLQLFSTGFQMSYSVVTALVVMGRPLADRWRATWKPFAFLPRANWGWHHRRIEEAGAWFFPACAGCWAAFLASTPSGIGYFGLFSPGSLVANLLIIPASVVVMWAGFVSIIAGLAGLLPVSAAANLVAVLAVAAMDWALRHGTQLPATWFQAHYRADWIAPWSLVLITAVMLAGAAGRWSPRRGGFWPPVVALALLMLLGVKFG